MKKLFLAACAAVWCATVSASFAQSGAADDSARAALEADLEKLLGELQPIEQVDPFETGEQSADLIVVSTNNVFGEVAPCG